MLIGLKDGEKLSAAKVARALAASEAKGAPGRIGVKDPSVILGGLVAASARMRAYAAAAPFNTDDNAYVAFHGLGEAMSGPFNELMALQEDPALYVDPTLDSVRETESLLQYLHSRARPVQPQTQ